MISGKQAALDIDYSYSGGASSGSRIAVLKLKMNSVGLRTYCVRLKILALSAQHATLISEHLALVVDSTC